MGRTTSECRAIADAFRIRASAASHICAGEIGLTDVQKEKVATYKKRIIDFKNGVAKVTDLTDKMKAELSALLVKEKNPELPVGAKTYCKAWLKEYLYGRRAPLKNKYVAKGNTNEDDGFTLMAVQLGLGMVYKNEEYRENNLVRGTCDLHHELKPVRQPYEKSAPALRITHDNKCSFDLSTFPMFETEIPNMDYWWQLQTYSILWPSDLLSLCYTLTDVDEENLAREMRYITDQDERYEAACRLIYTPEGFEAAKAKYFPLSTLDTFVPIPDEDRVRQFTFKPEEKAIQTINTRAQMCKDYIFELLTTKK